jgi:hypothetical protein
MLDEAAQKDMLCVTVTSEVGLSFTVSVLVSRGGVFKNVIQIERDGKPFVSVKPDGDVEFGDGYSPSEAAGLFWKSMAYLPAEFLKAAHLVLSGQTVMPLTQDERRD